MFASFNLRERIMLNGRGRYWLVLSVLFMLSFAALRLLAGNTWVSVNITLSGPDTFKVYWTTADQQGWTEARSASTYVNARKQRYVLRLPVAAAKVDQLRVDPGDHAGRVTRVSEISLYGLGVDSLRFDAKSGFAEFSAIQHVENLRTRPVLSYKASGNDPGFVVDLAALEARSGSALMWLQAAMLALMLVSLRRRLPWLFQNLRWVPAGLLIVASAALVLALLSKQGAHPDESVHLKAANYYASHYLPAQVCSEASRYTYSAYGVSRTNNREIAYVAAGRYLQLVEFVPAAEYLKLRFLNLSMFFILVLLAFSSVVARYLFLPVLLTPQSWYLFSYYNSDALSLFAVLITAYQVFAPESMLRRVLRGARPPAYVLWLVGLTCLVAMQYWLKLNYVFYPMLLGMLGVSWLWANKRFPDFSQSKPLWWVLALGTALFFSWELSRHAINDFELGLRTQQCSELLAADAYKPSTPLQQSHPNLWLKDKGVTLSDMLGQRQWAKRIFFTGLGAYGYTEYLNRDVHYQVASFMIVLLFLYVLFSVLNRGGRMERLSVLSVLLALSGITMAAAYNNWTSDFQPQGRYLMVYLPIFGTLMAMYHYKLRAAWLSVLAAVPFLLALYSFFAIALIEIPR